MRSYEHLTFDEATAHLQRYVASLPAAVQRLRERAARTGGPELDGSVDSVVGVEVWFHEQLLANADDDSFEVPVWWVAGTENGRSFDGRPRLSLRQVRLVDEIAAYFAEVLQRAVPQAHWEVGREDPQEIKYNKTVLRGPFGDLDLVSVVYGQALGPITRGKTPEPGIMHRWILSNVAGKD